MAESQAYQIGQMAQAIRELTDQVKEQNKRIKALEDKYKTGRGLIVGALITVGFVAYGFKGMLAKLFGIVL